MSKLYLLTAPSGAGKTSFCHALAAEANAAGWDVAGILSPPIVENGIKTGIRVQNLRTQETQLLAVASPSSLPTPHFPLSTSHFPPPTSHFPPPTSHFPHPTSHFPHPTSHSLPPPHISLGYWRFDPSALAWGNDLLASCLPADLFIVDELGPLELLRGAGWQNALQALRQRTYKIGIAVVRPSLLDVAQDIYPHAQILSLPQEAYRFFLSLQGV